MKRHTHPAGCYRYPLQPVVHGYAGRTLAVNLTTGEIRANPVTDEMKRLFTGGKGFCLWLLWNAVNVRTRWDSPENELVFASGPIGGILSYPGSGKTTVATISPLTGAVIDSNGGGHFGPYLKFAGWDALEIQGASQGDVVLYIDGDIGEVSLQPLAGELDFSDGLLTGLLERFARSERDQRNLSVVFTGQAANHVPITGLNISYYDLRRKEQHIKQCARGGAGHVFRKKKLAAIVVRYSSLGLNSNGPARPDLLRKAGKRMNKEIHDFDAGQNDMRGVGTPYLLEVTNHFDLLPVHNYRFGSHVDTSKIAGEIWKAWFDHSNPDNCWYGCTLACAHSVPHFHPRTGPDQGKAVRVDGPEYETLGALGSNCGIFDPHTVLEMNHYADLYGIDTISLGNSIGFAMECYQYGILNLERTGGIDLCWGNGNAALELIHQMASGQGFGLTVGQGVRAMKSLFSANFGADPAFLQDIGMEVKGLEISEYVTKESLSQQAGYAMAVKGAQHDEACMVFMDQVRQEIPTIEQKARALYFFTLFRTWFGLHGLCRLPWNDITPASNQHAHEPSRFPEHIENYTWLYEGVTGVPVTVDDLIRQSEIVYNFHRIFNLKLGFGIRRDDYPPYRAMGPVTEEEYQSRSDYYDDELRRIYGQVDQMGFSEKIAALRRYREAQYNLLVDAVYQQRGWSELGIPTKFTLERLGLDFPEILELVERHHGAN